MDNLFDKAKDMVSSDDILEKAKGMLSGISEEEKKLVEVAKDFLSKANIDLAKVLADGKLELKEIMDLGKTLMKLK